MKKTLLSLILFLLLPVFLWSAAHTSKQPHEGAITALAIGKNALFSAGEDGFIVRWDESGNGDHYQISDYRIEKMSVSPNGSEIAVYETDGYSVNRISVWNWQTQTRKFAKRLGTTVTSLAYSKKGTYLMIGTTTMDGILFLNATRGTVLTKVTDPAGIISFSQTSATENSSVMYTPLGKLLYTNLRSGKRKTSFELPSNLEQSVMYNNDLFFAGVKENSIIITKATTGENAGKIKAQNPILCVSQNDKNLYYLEQDGRNLALYMIETEGHHVIETPLLVKKIKITDKDAFTTVIKHTNTIFAGTKSGRLYSFSTSPSTEITAKSPFTKNIYGKILDVEATNGGYYFLTASSVFKSSYSDSTISTIAKNDGQTNFIPFDDSVILWSKTTKKSVTKCDLSTPDKREVLFTPKLLLQNIRTFKNSLIYIEGSSNVKLYNLETGDTTILYTGTGIQDALLYTENDLYVAKTASGTSQSSLIHVDVLTKEMVSTPCKNNVAFSLSANTKKNGPFYGVSVTSSGNTPSTEIFAYYPSQDKCTAVLKLADEDTSAFSYILNNTIYTNIGKNQIRSYNLSTRKITSLARFASLPVKICGNGTILLVLNKDGSISWYNSTTHKLLVNWYVTKEGKWLAY